MSEAPLTEWEMAALDAKFHGIGFVKIWYDEGQFHSERLEPWKVRIEVEGEGE